MEPNANPNQPMQSNPEQLSPQQPESAPAPVAPERAPQAPSAGPTDPLAKPTIPQIPTPAPTTQPQDPTATSSPTPVAGTPAVAADVDRIEKEWVDQANRIVEQTKNDPYNEEEAVEALQADYLKKRYGHEVKKPDSK